MRIIAFPDFEKTRNSNPYLYLLYTNIVELGVRVDGFSPQRAIRNRYDIWHLHWPESFLNNTNPVKAVTKTHILLSLMDWARARGTKIVWTVHNLSAHEQLYPWLETRFWRAFTRRIDGYISLSESGSEAVQQHFSIQRDIPAFVIPHGHYRGAYPDYLDQPHARALLAIRPSAKVILFFGQIRPYKGVAQLTRAFLRCPDPGAVLYIVGRPVSSALAEALGREAASDPRVRLHFGFVPENKVQMYLRAADLVVLPYGEVLNSGSALLALSFDRPVLVPLRGALGELQAQVGGEWVRTYTGDITSFQIGDALRWALRTPRSVRAPLAAFDWKELAQRTVKAYKALI